MKVTIRCQHCGEKSYVEDMGAFRCKHCGKFFVSMSEYMRQKIYEENKKNE